MADIAVSCKGVVNLLKNPKPHTAAGPDDITLMLLRQAAEKIASAITLVFQDSLNQGSTPLIWRTAPAIQFLGKLLNQMQVTNSQFI